MKINKKVIFSAAITVLLLLLVFALNLITPLYADDYSYMFDFVTKTRIGSIGDIFRSMKIHYLKVNGRYVTHFLAQFFLLLGKPTFNVLNTAIIAFVILSMCKLANLKKSLFSFGGALSLLLIWLCTPNFGQSCLWVTGASNYLWGLAIILAFMLAFISCNRESGTPNGIKCVFLFLFGALAGNTTENAAGALIVWLICYTAIAFFHKRKLNISLYFGFVGTIAGTALMVFSPGERARLSGSGTFDISLLFSNTVNMALRYIKSNYLILIAIAVILVYRFATKKLTHSDVEKFATYLITSLAAAFALILSPSAPDRALSCATFFCVIALLTLLDFNDKKKSVKILISVTLLLLIAVFILSYVFAFSDLISVRYLWEEREIIAQSQLSDNADELYLPSISSSSPYSPFEEWGDLETDCNDWKNVALARYFGVSKTIRSDT